MKFIFIALLLVLVAGCTKSVPPTVLLDTWWDREYAKQSCESASCADDPALLVRDFELTLQTQFAAQTGCRSVQFLTFEGPTVPNPEVWEAMQHRYWTLSLNYDPRVSKQNWQMSESQKANLLQGEGIPAEIAREVCNIVMEKGAKLAN